MGKKFQRDTFRGLKNFCRKWATTHFKAEETGLVGGTWADGHATKFSSCERVESRRSLRESITCLNSQFISTLIKAENVCRGIEIVLSSCSATRWYHFLPVAFNFTLKNVYPPDFFSIEFLHIRSGCDKLPTGRFFELTFQCSSFINAQDNCRSMTSIWRFEATKLQCS